MKRLMIALAAFAVTPLCAQAQPVHTFTLNRGFGDATLSWPQIYGEDGHEMICGVDGGGLRVAVMVPDRQFPTRERTVHLANGETDSVLIDSRGRREPWHGAMTLSTGHVRLTTPATAEYALDAEAPPSHAVTSSTEMPLNAALLSEFARTGRLTVTTLGYTQTLPSPPLAMIRDFSARCRAAARARR
jgi:hypothetical protein